MTAREKFEPRKFILVCAIIFAAGGLYLPYAKAHPYKMTPTTTTSTTTAAATGRHSMCNRDTGECYDPGADYIPSEDDPQYYGY